MAPQVFVWQYPDVFNSFSFCVCCYENKRICRPDDWLCRDCHGKCRTFKSRMGSVVSVTATYFLVQGKLQSTGYPTLLSVSIIILVSAVGFLMTFHHFKKEDLK